MFEVQCCPRHDLQLEALAPDLSAALAVHRARANVMPTAWLGTILQLPRLVTIHHGLPEGTGAHRCSTCPRFQCRRFRVEPPSVVFLGRLVSTKGVHILLQAVHQLPDCEFQLNIVGDGPERARLEADVRSLGLEERVSFRGYLPANEVEQSPGGGQSGSHAIAGGEIFGLVALENMLRKKSSDCFRDWSA